MWIPCMRVVHLWFNCLVPQTVHLITLSHCILDSNIWIWGTHAFKNSAGPGVPVYQSDMWEGLVKKLSLKWCIEQMNPNKLRLLSSGPIGTWRENGSLDSRLCLNWGYRQPRVWEACSSHVAAEITEIRLLALAASPWSHLPCQDGLWLANGKLANGQCSF